MKIQQNNVNINKIPYLGNLGLFAKLFCKMPMNFYSPFSGKICKPYLKCNIFSNISTLKI